MFVTHEALGESLEIPRADALDIHSDCLVVEGQTQAVSRMRKVEWLNIAFRLAVLGVSDGNILRCETGAPGQLTTENRAEEGIIPATLQSCLLLTPPFPDWRGRNRC